MDRTLGTKVDPSVCGISGAHTQKKMKNELTLATRTDRTFVTTTKGPW